MCAEVFFIFFLLCLKEENTEEKILVGWCDEKNEPHCASLDIKHHPAVRFTATCKSCFISLEVFKLFAASNAAGNISGRCFSRLLRFGQWSIEVRKKVHEAVFFLQGVFNHAARNDRTLVKKMQTKENKSKRPSFSTVSWLVLGTWCRR